jgi:competence protein ComEA
MSGIPLARSHAALAALAVLVALALVGRRLADVGTAQTEAPAQATLSRLKPAAPVRLVVHVAGAVRRPGVYRFADGARVADAISRAGGSTRAADLDAVNLAAPLADGLQVLVPAAVAPAPADGSTAPADGAALVGGKVHLSAASVEQLDDLPGVGPVTAQKIVDWRTAHGPFRTLEDLDAIPGIGPSRIEQLRDLVVP